MLVKRVNYDDYPHGIHKDWLVTILLASSHLDLCGMYDYWRDVEEGTTPCISQNEDAESDLQISFLFLLRV